MSIITVKIYLVTFNYGPKIQHYFVRHKCDFVRTVIVITVIVITEFQRKYVHFFTFYNKFLAIKCFFQMIKRSKGRKNKMKSRTLAIPDI